MKVVVIVVVMGLISMYQYACFVNVDMSQLFLFVQINNCSLVSLLMCTCVVIQRSICSELEREKAELTLNSVPASDIKSRQTVADLLQQLQKQKQINVRILQCTLYHMNACSENTVEYNGII